MPKLEMLKQAGDSRDLAARGRRLTRAFTAPEDRARIEQYVEELEASAVRLETEAEALE